MKEEREILSGIDAPLKKRQGGGGAIMAPPGKLGLKMISNSLPLLNYPFNPG